MIWTESSLFFLDLLQKKVFLVNIQSKTYYFLGHSILIFCPIKSWVEKLAEAVAKDLFFVGKPDPEDKDSVSCDVRSVYSSIPILRGHLYVL